MTSVSEAKYNKPQMSEYCTTVIKQMAQADYKNTHDRNMHYDEPELKKAGMAQQMTHR